MIKENPILLVMVVLEIQDLMWPLSLTTKIIIMLGIELKQI